MRAKLTDYPLASIPDNIHDAVPANVRALLQVCGVTWVYNMVLLTWVLHVEDPIRGVHVDSCVGDEIMWEYDAMVDIIKNLYCQLGAAPSS